MITGAETAGLVGRPSPIYLEGRLPLLLQAKDVLALGLRDGKKKQKSKSTYKKKRSKTNETHN